MMMKKVKLSLTSCALIKLSKFFFLAITLIAVHVVLKWCHFCLLSRCNILITFSCYVAIMKRRTQTECMASTNNVAHGLTPPMQY